MDSEVLAGMTKDQLLAFAAEQLGRVLDYNWPTSKILTSIMNAAVAVRDGA